MTFFLDFESIKTNEDLELSDLELKYMNDADYYTPKFINSYVAIRNSKDKKVKQATQAKKEDPEEEYDDLNIPTFEEMGITTKIIYLLLVIAMITGVVISVKKLFAPKVNVNDDIKRKREEKKLKKQNKQN